MEIFLAIISSITAVCVAFISRKQSTDDVPEKFTKLSNEINSLKQDSKDNFKTLTNKIKEVYDDMQGVNRSMSTLKREIQDIHISHAKINTEEVKQNFGKVILLEEKSQAFEKMHLLAAREINDLKKKSKDGA